MAPVVTTPRGQLTAMRFKLGMLQAYPVLGTTGAIVFTAFLQKRVGNFVLFPQLEIHIRGFSEA